MMRVVFTTLAAGLLVGGILAAGHFLREDLRSRDRHLFAVGEIECAPPPGMTREQFLSEVHYYGQLPEKMSALDDGINEKLSAAFAKHPKVRRVESVTIVPPKQVKIVLVFESR
jgi:hypothetical protein